MRGKRTTGRRRRRLLKAILLLIIAAAVGFGIWQYMAPVLVSGSVKTYESYTVRRGDVASSKSFSATLSVGGSETHYNDDGAESIRTLYVRGGQDVKKGDKLMELSNGSVLTAGIDGVVNEIRYSPGDWLRPNVQLAQVCDLTHLQVSLQVDEYDVKNVSAGQKCIITVVPLGMSFETELTHVSRISSASGRVAYYAAKAELTVPEQVLPGMTASVTIPAQEVQDVLVLDTAALSFDDMSQPYVLRREDEGYIEVPVETGLSDGMQIEIISGLQEGETVWVVSGEEKTAATFSLSDLYRKIFGERVIINGGSGGMNRMPGMGGSRGGEPQASPEGRNQGEEERNAR